ncbi:recombination regulator RecX [Burkholderia alba]|uniref:recombination regulator RecX n=1 Tax=Burkholderia alba TaxID=2683677 RepID=UPI002B05861F|nr:recombination regulator RecX [Burkholderia alba]
MQKNRGSAGSSGAGRRGQEAPDASARLERQVRMPGSTEGRPAGRPATGASDDAPVSFQRSDPFASTDVDESFDAHDVERNRGATGDAQSGAPAGGDVYTRTSQSPYRSKRRASPFAEESADAGGARASGPRQSTRSLKGRALAYLSRREYSRSELARKLASYVDEGDDLDAVLDALEREGWLSDARFAESLVHRRASRVGSARIVSELKRHAVGDALVEEVGAQLRESEFARAQAVWRKKFGVVPQTPAERAKQVRFLAMRGFSQATIMKLLKVGDEMFGDD